MNLDKEKAEKLGYRIVKYSNPRQTTYVVERLVKRRFWIKWFNTEYWVNKVHKDWEGDWVTNYFNNLQDAERLLDKVLNQGMEVIVEI